MPRFLRDFLLFVLLQAALIGVLLWFFYDVKIVSPLSPATVIKHKRLTDAPSPRMILIGGSNLLFGLDSPMIEQQTPYNPVNMGLIGGLRIDYITNEIKDELRPGDLVVMCLEYNTLNAEPDNPNTDETQVILGVTAQRFANWRFISWPQWKKLLDQGVAQYLGIIFRQAFANIIIRDNDNDPPINDDLNAYGDLTRYHDPTVKPRKANNQNTLVKIHPEAVQANIARLNMFIADCRKRGVKVMFAYPPLPHTHYQRGEALARKFQRLLRAQLDAPVICTPADMVFNDRDFIGLSYHLRGTAVQERTQRLIDAVKRRLAKDAEGGPTTEPTPEPEESVIDDAATEPDDS